jgi:hypothetical protein
MRKVPLKGEKANCPGFAEAAGWTCIIGLIFFTARLGLSILMDTFLADALYAPLPVICEDPAPLILSPLEGAEEKTGNNK